MEINYIERHRHWQEQAVNQLSIANNFLLTMSTGLLAFVFDKNLFAQMHFTIRICDIDLSKTFYGFSLFFILLSIWTGIIVLVSRLYDFRITRHVTLVRQRFYQNNKEKISVEDKNAAVLSARDFKYPSIRQRVVAIFKVLFVKIEFINSEEMSYVKADFPSAKFNSLRELSFWLGAISWKWTKLQGLYFFISALFYCIFLWTK